MQIWNGGCIFPLAGVPNCTLKRTVEENTAEIQLIRELRDSDVGAFRLLFDRYQPIVFRNVLFQTRQTDLAHDIVQETFLRVWEHRGSLQPHLSFLAYLFRISGNLVRDAVRHQRTRQKVEPALPPPPVSERDDPEEALARDMLEEKLNVIITRNLARRCRTIFLLSRVEGKSHQEIADILGLSVRTVEHQINHALKVLRRNLRGYL